MARTVADTNLGTREARRRLPARARPYWRSLEGAVLHVGYRKGPRGGRWIARRYLGGGRYLEQVIGAADDTLDPDGERVLSWGQAQARARDWRLPTPAGPYRVADAVRDYLDWYRSERKAVAETEAAVAAHILPDLGSIPVVGLTTEQIIGWRDRLAATPARVRSGRGQPVRHRVEPAGPDATRARRSTVNRVMTILKAALNRAFAEGLVESDRAWRRAKPFRGADAARVRWLSEVECIRLINACPPDLRLLVRAALSTGARYGELTRMTAGDYHSNGDGAAVQVTRSKSGRPRWIPLDDPATAFFEMVTAGRALGDLLFTRADGRPWGRSHQHRALLEACAVARIDPPASFHILRHTVASHRVMRGMPLLAVATVLGHTDTRMVERHYGHLAPSFLRDEVKRTALDLGPGETTVVTTLRR
jgi:integrase